MIYIDENLDIDFKDIGPWRCYRLDTFGDNQKELIENATIEEIDQDGGTIAYYDIGDADKDVFTQAMQLIKSKL